MSLQSWDEGDPFSFSGSVGRDGENDRADVIKAQMLLAEAGALDLPKPGLPTGWAGEGLAEAIRHVQRANDLPVDGLLLPLRDGAVGENGEGETLQVLKAQVGHRLGSLPVPTPDEVDSFFDAYARDPETEPRFQRPEKRDFGSGKKGSQEAMLPLALPLLAVGAPLALGAGEYLRQQYEKSRRANFTRPPEAPIIPPSRPANDTEKAQTGIPPLQPPEPEAPLQGRPAIETTSNGEALIPPDIKKWASGLPPEQQPLADELAGIIVEAHRFGPQGSPRTVEATKIVTRECFDQLQKRPDLAGKLFHVAGSYKDGEDGEDRRLSEEWVPRQDTSGERGAEKLKGGVYVDSSFGPKDDEHKVDPHWARMQTVDFSRRADEHDPEGRYKREKDADIRLLQNMKTGVAEWARKMRPGETAEDYAAYAKIRCDRMWDKLEARLRRDGYLPAR